MQHKVQHITVKEKRWNGTKCAIHPATLRNLSGMAVKGFRQNSVWMKWFKWPSCTLSLLGSFRSNFCFLVGSQEPRLASVKRWKLAWFRHVARRDCVSKNRPWGHLEKVGDRYHDQQRKCCMDNIKKWTSLPMPELLTKASCRTDWKRISAKSSLMPPPPSPDDPVGQGSELN